MKNRLIEKVIEFVKETNHNYLSEDVAFQTKYVGAKIFERPIIGFGEVRDSLFLELQKENVIGKYFRMPLEWNAKGNTVISVFLPFTDKIKESNEVDLSYPSELWMHGRIEGQKLCNELGRYLVDYLETLGYQTICPTIDANMKSMACRTENVFTSNWSERHIAFVCGLGTFGLSKGLITKKGVAGRFISVITEMRIEKTPREYEHVYEYCNMCGACIKNCPVNAISYENGKEHSPCSVFLDDIFEKHHPYYGCGKCQINVPCMEKNPIL